jgi:lipopolysaccharide assembly outer membrane protein LptD (OstA)/lipopolysaccharide export system protein LptA
MNRILAILLVALTAAAVLGQAPRSGRLDLQHSDLLEVVLSNIQDTTFVIGSVVFQSDNGLIYCDSAIWLKGKNVRLIGSVVIDDPAYRLTADSVDYSLTSGDAIARGKYVELWSRDDSLFAVGHHAFYNKFTRFFSMEERPTLYLKYPDSAAMVEVTANYVEYDAPTGRAEATGEVIIKSRDVTAEAGCAIMYPKTNALDLSDQPLVRRGKSEISGQLICLSTLKNVVAKIDVLDSAKGSFVEPTEGSKDKYDRSALRGRRIIMDFDDGLLSRIGCYGQAYSWYYPAAQSDKESNENSVSGDTIRFAIKNERLQTVTVIGGSVGTYVSTKTSMQDTIPVTKADTIDYSSQRIDYSVKDSVITLTDHSHVTSGTVALDAHRICFDTRRRLITAFSADVPRDSGVTADSALTAKLQPNVIPVALKDKDEVILGDYLEYSIDTEKGKIAQSKSKYETGFYYGEKVYRSTKDIFYVDDGRYTTCDADEPHFHFYSKHMKLMEGNKLIAKPVVLNIGRIPILALPYYVFPMKKGRHSGFLPFQLGNIEQGQMYVRNVGYYWAASEYWDTQAALDYYDKSSTVNLYGKLNYRKLYLLDGSISGNYTRSTDYSSSSATDVKRTRWTIQASHNHELAPSFKISASGQYQSDNTYYKDYSLNLDERLNRSVTSKLNFTKRFSKGVALSGAFTHTENLDQQSRTDYLPSAAMTVPTIKPLGSGSRDASGELKTKWYQALSVTWRPSVTNFSSRVTKDTASTADSSVMLSYRSRKEFTRFDHSAGASLPVTIAKYFIFNPSFSYSENWSKVYRTDQSDTLDIDPSKFYRTYSYSTGASLSTKLYGTVYPNMLGLVGFRQVLSPTMSYGFTPKVDPEPVVRGYVGGAGNGSRSSYMTFGLSQVYQARVKKGETEQSLDLLSISSNASYDFEKTEKPLSNLSTTFSSYVLPDIRLNGSMVHSFYHPETGKLHLWSPYLQSFGFSTTFGFSGRSFLFDEVTPRRMPQDSGVTPGSAPTPSAGKSTKSGWNLSATYAYSESGRRSAFVKSSYVQFSINFRLTPTTEVAYSQYYDFTGRGTINNQVSIGKDLHCWRGEFWWVPVGSNHGYGFRLYVIAIPALKLDNTQSPTSGSLLFRQ